MREVEEQELAILKQLSAVVANQEKNRKASWKLEERENDYRLLAKKQEAYLNELIYTNRGEHHDYFAEMEEELSFLQRKNLAELEEEREALYEEAKALTLKEEALLSERRSLLLGENNQLKEMKDKEGEKS